MSDFPADYADRLNLREQIACIDRNQAEIGKLLAEQNKLTAEQARLAAEADKFRRDRFLVSVWRRRS